MTLFEWVTLGLLGLICVLLMFVILLVKRNQQREWQAEIVDMRQSLLNQSHEQQQQSLQKQFELQKQLQSDLHSGFKEINQLLSQQHFNNRKELTTALQQHAEAVNKQLIELRQTTEKRLDFISENVNKKLSEGFEKTVETFGDILKRLALIDEAQKKISELSSNVVSLQSVLSDKGTRGLFGEVQLYSLVDNVLSPSQWQKQATLSNGKIADCLLKLPQPTGNIVVDSKFPLDNYKRMTNFELAESDRLTAERQFKMDVKKHIEDIANKYILPGETADSAILFLPAEAIFAEIHARHNDLVEKAWQRRVWLTSPSTLMAVLTTARAVLKDEATRAQVSQIQTHLVKLGLDFSRFQSRFDQLSKHIDQAATDVRNIHISSKKISDRFQSIEQLDLAQSQSLEAKS